jgi:hypothetical protein
MKNIIITAYLKKLEKTIEKKVTAYELFSKERVRKGYMIKNLENLKGKEFINL